MRTLCLSLSISIASIALSTSTAYGEDLLMRNRMISPISTRQPSILEQVATAQGGVDLLEHILQRMRNLPQLAISKTKQTIAFKNQALSPTNEVSQSNVNLLIKPKDLSRALQTKNQLENSLLASSQGGQSGNKIADAIAQSGASLPTTKLDNFVRQATGSADGIWEREEGVASGASGDSFADRPGNIREYAADDREKKAAKEEAAKRIVVSTTPLITEFQNQARADKSDEGAFGARLAKKGRVEVSGYLTARNKPMAGFYPAPGAYPPPAQILPNTTAAAPRPAEISSVEKDYKSPRQNVAAPARIAAQGKSGVRFQFAPNVFKSEKAPSLATLPKSNFAGSPSAEPTSGLGGADLSLPDEGFYIGNRKRQPLSSDQRAGWRRRDFDLALLPPTVVTGISLVRLGNSEKDAAKAVASLGGMQKASIHGWSVWSVRKRNCTNCAIQIFFRHGTVEAIRIFDSSLLKPELGVALGDCLSTVKEKFGEPAFILSEPTSLTTQNYIYPISQIGFQLARENQEEAPKIISMIVFNVK